MAKITPSALVQGIAGRIGSVYFQRRQGNLSASLRRKNAKACNAKTQNIKSLSARLRAHWATLSDEERLSWNALARLVAQTSNTAHFKQKRGYTLFLEYNFYPLFFGDAITNNAPNTYMTESSNGFIWTYIAPGTFLVANQIIGTAGTRYQLYYVRQGMRGNQKSALASRIMFFTVKDGVTLRNVAATYEAQFGPRINDQLLEVGCITQRVGFFPSSYVSQTHII